MTSIKAQLIIENEELQYRLAEAETALAEIRAGNHNTADPAGKAGRGYTASSDESLFRTLIEEMDEGAVTLSMEGIIIYCNQRFASFIGQPVEQVVGSQFGDYLAPDDRIKFTQSLSGQHRKKRNALIISLQKEIYLKLSFHFLASKVQEAHIMLVATDISPIRKEQMKLLELSDQLENKLDLIKQLRMQVIEKKIEVKGELDRTRNVNKKLVREISLHKMVIADLRSKLKGKNRLS